MSLPHQTGRQGAFLRAEVISPLSDKNSLREVATTPPSDRRLLQTKFVLPSSDKELLEDKRAMSPPLDRKSQETGATSPLPAPNQQTGVSLLENRTMAPPSDHELPEGCLLPPQQFPKQTSVPSETRRTSPWGRTRGSLAHNLPCTRSHANFPFMPATEQKLLCHP